MSQTLTIAYNTCRKDPKWEWFFDSLNNQLKEVDMSGISLRVIVIDFWNHERLAWDGMEEYPFDISFHSPKPTTWQGKYRLTSQDYFAAASHRNTAICLAMDGFLAMVDDLSVLMPGWLLTVRQAMNWNGITLGAYKKVRNLLVENGIAKSWDEFNGGIDTRLSAASGKPMPCGGEWLFGCSLVAPVEALLTVGGWFENCDGLGFEDSITGIALQNAGFKFQYCPSMLTLESEELHAQGPVMKRLDKGKSPLDKSHSILAVVQGGCKYTDNYYEGGLRAERERVLRGEPFKIRNIPEHDWYDGQALKDM